MSYYKNSVQNQILIISAYTIPAASAGIAGHFQRCSLIGVSVLPLDFDARSIGKNKSAMRLKF
jgi:hypothetical protein